MLNALLRHLSLLSTFGASGFALANASYDVDHDKGYRRSSPHLYGFTSTGSILRNVLIVVSMFVFFASYQFSAVLALTTFGIVRGTLFGGLLFGVFALYFAIQFFRGQWSIFLAP